MRKVKVIKSTSYFCYECDQREIFAPASGDWNEVTDDEYSELQEAVDYANRNRKDNGWYFVVEYSDDITAEVFESARHFKEEMKKREQEEQKRKEEAKKKRAAKAEERKRKQLEKLKKELGES